MLLMDLVAVGKVLLMAANPFKTLLPHRC